MSEVASSVEVEIRRPLGEVADLFADPANNVKWMHDIARCRPLSGEPGMPGSTYELIPKKREERTFVVTVLTRRLPEELGLVLTSDDVDVAVVARMTATDAGGTKLVHNEMFTLKAAGGGPGPADARRAGRGGAPR